MRMNTNKFTRLLVIGKRGGILQWYEHLIDAGESLNGVEVKGFALNHNNFYERATKKIAGWMSPCAKENVTKKRLIRVLDYYKPQLIIIADMFYFSDDLISALITYRKDCCFTHWIGDFYTSEILRSKPLIHHFFFTDTALVNHAKSLGLDNSSYLPLAYNPRIFTPPETNKKRSNLLLFVGAWSKNRERIINDIDYPMLVIGKGWGKKLNRENHKVVSKNINQEELAKLYQEYNYVLNIINTENIKNGLNMRCFEAPGCKALLVTDDVKDLPYCYTENLDVLVYDTACQIPTLLASQNKKSQTATIENGHKIAQEMHTYKVRIQSIINISSLTSKHESLSEKNPTIINIHEVVT